MCNENEREFNFRNFWGSESKSMHLKFRRDRTTYCIYCGETANTREHAPSRIFLYKPYPDNLIDLPACKKCNNSFSADELYSEVYIDSLKYLSGYSDSLTKENNLRIYKTTAFYDAQCTFKQYIETGKIALNNHLKRILTKLSICHCIYELSEGYSTGDKTISCESIEVFFRFNTRSDNIKEFLMPVMMNDKILPELGSRVFDNIYVLEPVLSPVSGDEDKKIAFAIMLWTVVQENNYEYVAWIQDDKFHVKIAIHNFLFSHVVFKMDES